MELWQQYNKKLSDAVDQGYSPKLNFYDKDLADSLKQNIAIFSAFKEASFNQVLTELMIDENGGLRTWDEFKKLATQIDDKYNQRWLKTEYHQTVASANAAKKWKDIQRTKHLYPNLKYMTVGDDRVRDQHRDWHGKILPIEHPFWKVNFPPNDWGCRCDAERTNETPSPEAEIPDNLKNEKFKNNPGMTGKVFTDDHPYFNVDGKRMSREEVERYKLTHPNYVLNKKYGIEVSAWADQRDLSHNLVIAQMFYNQLRRNIKIRPHVQGVETGIGKKGFSNPEFLIDGKYFADVKTWEKGKIKDVFSAAKNQGNHIAIFQIKIGHPLNRVKEMINGEIMMRGENPFEEIWILIDGELHAYP